MQNQPGPDTHLVLRSRLQFEIVLVLGLSLGKSAVYALLALLRAYTSPTPIGKQTTQLNPTRADEALWDAIYQVLSIAFDLFLVALVLYLLWEPGRRVFRSIGLDFTRFGSDTVRALLIGVCIGVPGLGLYLAGRAMGLTPQVQTAPDALPWWMYVVLVLSALRAGLLEEVILLGWLFDRLRRLGVGPVATIFAAATVRGLYHAYQGFPGIIGNFVMGLVFGWAYHRWGRVMPLVIAHTLIDIVAFTALPLGRLLFPTLI